MTLHTDAVMVSGGFDPLTKGHVRLLKEARRLKNARNCKLVVVLNSDEWLKRKKGYVFMDFKERREILKAIQGVDVVLRAHDGDETVAKDILLLSPRFFVNGGDRTKPVESEKKACEKVGCKMVFNAGGEKVSSSSQLVKRVYGRIRSLRRDV